MTQLERLAKPFPQRLIHSNPSGGGSYVKHSVVTEKLLAVVGPFDFELVEVIRGDVEGTEPNPAGTSARAKRGTPALTGSIVGAVCRLSADVDGRRVRVEEVGDCESPHNWPHDGARLKDAMSDALKRCAMRLGVTLHLWSGAEFSLYEQLHAENAEGRGQATTDATSGEAERVRDDRPSATSPAVEVREHSAAANDPESSSPSGTPGQTSKARRDRLKSRCMALQSDNVSVADAREALGLPLVDSCDDDQLTRFEAMVDDLEAALTKPFETASA